MGYIYDHGHAPHRIPSPSESINLLDIELQEGDIRTVDLGVLYELEMTQKATIRGLFNGDQTVAFAFNGGVNGVS